MDFDQLATFVYVAKLKSFSRAGQKVFRSQSAVSAQIRQLEQAYHARLLDRSAKSVELTPAGLVAVQRLLSGAGFDAPVAGQFAAASAAEMHLAASLTPDGFACRTMLLSVSYGRSP